LKKTRLPNCRWCWK